MSITFDNPKNITYIYRNIGGSFENTNYGNTADFDLFNDNASQDDAIYFGVQNRSWSFHNLKFNVGTALQADNIVIRWEYNKQGTWTEIPNVIDNTNAFQNTGVNEVLFDVPENMNYSLGQWGVRINGKYALWIRCRIDSVSNITEGGANATDKVMAKDFTITCDNEATLTLEDIQNASDAGGWEARSGVPAVETNGLFTIIRPHLFFTGTTSFTAKNRMIQMGETNYPQGFHSNATGATVLGELDSSGKGKNGCSLYLNSKYAYPYDTINNFQCYGSVITRPYGMYGALSLAGVFKFIDSVFNSNERWYISHSVAGGSEWTRSVYACTDLIYVYSPNLAIDTFKSIDNWQGILSGYDATISNTDINGGAIHRYYSAQIQLINCSNIDRTNITSTAPNVNNDLHVREKYSLTLKTIATDSSPLENIKISMFDVNNTNQFSLVSDSNGNIPEQTITVYDKWWEYANNWAEHNDDFNPFRLSYRAYGYKSSDVIITLLSKTQNSKLVEVNPFVVKSETDAGNITDIDIDGVAKTITVNGEKTINDLYDYVQYWQAQTDNLIYDEPLQTVDGSNYILADGWTLVLNALIQDGLNIQGNVNLNIITDLNNYNINGVLTFSQYGLYNITNSNIKDVENTSGGNITIKTHGTPVNIETVGSNITVDNTIEITAPNLVDGTTVEIYNITDGTLIDFSTVSGGNGYSYSLNFPGSKTLSMRATYANGTIYKKPIESIGVLTSTGLTFLETQEDWEELNSFNIDGSTVSEFSSDYTNIQVDVNDNDGITQKYRLVCWWAYILTTQDGIRNFFGAIDVEDNANFKIISSKVNLKLENVGNNTVVFNDDTRLYMDDGSSIIAPTSKAIQIDSGKIYIKEMGSGLTEEEHNKLLATPNTTQLEVVNNNVKKASLSIPATDNI